MIFQLDISSTLKNKNVLVGTEKYNFPDDW